MADDVLPEALVAAYHERCNVEGADLADFLEEVRDRFSIAELVALVDKVEADVLSNMALMVEERPEMEAMAEAKATALRARFAELRAGLEASGS